METKDFNFYKQIGPNVDALNFGSTFLILEALAVAGRGDLTKNCSISNPSAKHYNLMFLLVL